MYLSLLTTLYIVFIFLLSSLNTKIVLFTAWHQPVDWLLEIIALRVINLSFLGRICTLLEIANSRAIALYASLSRCGVWASY